MNKILVIGQGFVGEPLAKYLKADVWPKRLEDIYPNDIKDYDTIINTAAKTSIDWCEENKQETFNTNVVDAVRLALIIQEANNLHRKDTNYKIKHVFFSSACIFKSNFDGDIKYEDSEPKPQCFYTETKLMAERLITEIDPTTLIIRPRLLISENPHPRNTLNKLLKYDKVINTQESATILEDMIPRIKELIESDASGPIHIFNENTISPSTIMDIFHKDHEVISKQELDIMTKDRAKRVSTILGSKVNEPLPDIYSRLKDIADAWQTSEGKTALN